VPFGGQVPALQCFPILWPHGVGACGDWPDAAMLADAPQIGALPLRDPLDVFWEYTVLRNTGDWMSRSHLTSCVEEEILWALASAN
jgi:hypothetical protein